MKVQIIEYSCHRQGLKVNRLRKFLVGNNYYLTKPEHKDELVIIDPEADIIILTTCGFIKKKEQECFELLRKINKSKKSSAKVIFGGCLLQLNPDRVAAEFKGPSFDSISYEKIDSIIEHRIPISNYSESNNIPFYDSYFIKIQSGCPDRCSYCVIWKTMKKVCSKPIHIIMEEFRRGIKNGHKKFYLIGECAGSYGIENGKNLGMLLNEFTNISVQFSLILEDIAPKYLDNCFEELLELCNQNKIKSLHIPIQSGSDRILKLMNRSHDMDRFKLQIKKLRNASVNLYLASTIIVGFPSETWDDIFKTIKLIKYSDFDKIKCHKFSNHPGTKASILKNHISSSEKEKRLSYYKKQLGEIITN
jgi:MiaB/RimO family radical SAM methylthiotransferase